MESGLPLELSPDMFIPNVLFLILMPTLDDTSLSTALLRRLGWVCEWAALLDSDGSEDGSAGVLRSGRFPASSC